MLEECVEGGRRIREAVVDASDGDVQGSLPDRFSSVLLMSPNHRRYCSEFVRSRCAS